MKTSLRVIAIILLLGFTITLLAGATPQKSEPAKAVSATAKKVVDKPVVAAAKPVTKPVRLAKVDPLAPLPAKHSGHSKDAPTGR